MTGNFFRQTEGSGRLPSVVPAGPAEAGHRGRPRRGRPPASGTRPRPGSLAAVLFDMDGLLVDSEPLWFEVESRVMARLGGTWGAEDQRALLGGSLERTVSYLLAKAPPNAPDPSRREVADWLLSGMLDLIAARGLPLLPGAAELLAAVAGAGIPQALVTSSQRSIMHAVLAATGVRFPVTVCGEDVMRTKPDPEPYLRAAALLGQDPRQCVVLEDSPNGVAAAEAAGCLVIVAPTVPMPASPGRIVVRSLREVSLATLWEAAAARVQGERS